MTTLAPSDVEGVRVLRIVGPLSQDGVDAIRADFVDQLRRDAVNVVFKRREKP